MALTFLQVKRETNFFIQNVEKNQRLKKIREKKRKKGESSGETESETEKSFVFKQRDPEEKIVSRKRKLTERESKDPSGKKVKKSHGERTGDSKPPSINRAADNKTFLMNIFSGGVTPKTKNPTRTEDTVSLHKTLLIF